jgi:hypothetical protein
MKKFSFPLERVLSWRQTQSRLEEAALARLQAELQSLDLRCVSLDQSVQDARAQLLAAPSATPIEIGALEHFRASASSQTHFLLQSRRALEQKLALQTQTALERRRDAQLLGQVRDRRWKSWQAATAREIDQQAEESFLARFTRNAVE